jgi:glycosyltransferase involved in cell wall biosynthesis
MFQTNGTSRRRLVAHITLGLDTGGQERLLVEFARHADRRYFDLVFLSLTTRGQLAGEIEALGWPVAALDEPPGLRPSLTLRVATWLRRRRVQIVHTHDSKPLVYGAPAARLAGAKRIIHTRHFARLPSVSRRQTILLRTAARFVDCFVCVSEDSAGVARSEGVRPGRVKVVHNGIDLERFPYRGPQADGPAVLVARLSPEKDVATLVRAVAQMAPQLPGFRLKIAGSGPCRAELADLIQKLGLAERVELLGEIRDISGLLAKASCFVLSSQTEGISLTLLEAMSSGLPVIATRVGGNPEVVTDGETGILVPASHPEALARALVEILNDPERSRQMGRAGRLRVQQHFDVGRMVQEYQQLYGSRAPTSFAEVNG